MIPVNTTETVEVVQTVAQPVQIVGVLPYQMHFDATDAYAPGGVSIIKAKLLAEDGSVVADRTYLFRGDYYINKISEPVTQGLTHREDFNATIAQVITEIISNPTLKEELISTGQLLIDPGMRFYVQT